MASIPVCCASTRSQMILLLKYSTYDKKSNQEFTFRASITTYMLPLNTFPHVFFLLLFQNQFNEELLQFLVTVIDAELFKTETTKRHQHNCHLTQQLLSVTRQSRKWEVS
jgi:hypothetical protein